MLQKHRLNGSLKLYYHTFELCLLSKVGETPLNVAVRYGHLSAIEFLCSSGANVNLKDNVSYINLKINKFI